MHFIKKLIKKIFVSVAFRGCPKIVIASTGRAGSTMLFQAIADSLVQSRFGVRPDSRIGKLIKRMYMGYVDRIQTLLSETCIVCKTHDTYENPANISAKYIFVYGDPLESAMSVEQMVENEGMDWFFLHQYHLKANGDYADLYMLDVLNYQGQLESWLTIESDNILCLDYDDIWDGASNLESFLGFSVKLPRRRPRAYKHTEKEINNQKFDDLRRLKISLSQR